MCHVHERTEEWYFNPLKSDVLGARSELGVEVELLGTFGGQLGSRQG
jgi:hypothetical protein